MSLQTRNAYKLDVQGKTRSGETHIVATGFQHGSLRLLDITLTNQENVTTNVSLSSDAKANSIVLRSHGAHVPTEMILTGLDSNDVGQISVRKGSSAPENFTVSVPTLIKSKSLVSAIQNGRGKLFSELVGEQDDLDFANDEYGPLLNSDKDFNTFVDKTEVPEVDIPLMAWYCWAIFLTPGLSIVGLFIRKCRL